MSRPVSLPPAVVAAMQRDEERDPLELLARMLVGGGYKIPTPGRSTRPHLGMEDIDGAAGMMGRKLPQIVAMAVAQRGETKGPADVAAAAFARARALAILTRAPLDLRKPKDRHQLRIVLHHAAEDLIWPERRQSQLVRAKAAKMRKADYRQVRHLADAILQEALHTGRGEFAYRLWCRPAPEADR